METDVKVKSIFLNDNVSFFNTFIDYTFIDNTFIDFLITSSMSYDSKSSKIRQPTCVTYNFIKKKKKNFDNLRIQVC